MFTKAFLLDALERLIWTFIQTFLGIVAADGFLDNTSVSWQDKLVAAAVAAAISAAKSVLALKVGSPTAQALPAAQSTYTYTPEAK